MKLDEVEAQKLLQELKFVHGLATAVVRDYKTKDVLMVAYQTRQALMKTLTTGLMHYWSRSRRKLWLKGEQSKHYQYVRDVWVDCDGDTLLFDVEQVGAACHDGYYSCFYRKLKGGKLSHMLKKKFEPKKVYR